MAKLKTEQINSTDLLEYVESYSDFSFELSVLKMLRDNEIECEHGGHYQDPVTNKSREFDIRATKTIQHFRIRMAIECKNIRENFPILISCVPRHEQDSYHQIAIVGEPEVKNTGPFDMPNLSLMHQSRAKTLSIRGDYSLYKPSEPVGKSTVQVGRTTNNNSISASDSELYEKWGQCLSSADDLVKRVYWDGEKETYLSTVVPFVVVPNGRLWMVAYDDEGNMTHNPKLTDRCSCFIDKDYEMGSGIANATMLLSHVEIVTFNGLKNFVDDHLKNIGGMDKVFSKEGMHASFD